MRINSLISVGELIDKISVLEIKKAFIKDKIKLKSINTELNSLRKGVKTLKYSNKWINKIKCVNCKIWVSVNRIWDCERKGVFGNRFIRLARNIYILNDKRYRIKQEINQYYNSYVKEEKSY